MILKYLTDDDGTEKCRLIKEGDHVHFGYDISKIAYGARGSQTDFTADPKIYAALMSALEHKEAIDINNDLFRTDPSPGALKWFVIEYKVAYDHFNIDIGSDSGTYKRRSVWEHHAVDFMWEILRIEYCSTVKGGFTRRIDETTTVNDKETFRRFYEQWIPREHLYICNELMGGDAYPGVEKRARMLARYPESGGYAYTHMDGDEGSNMNWSSPEESHRARKDVSKFFGSLASSMWSRGGKIETGRAVR